MMRKNQFIGGKHDKKLFNEPETGVFGLQHRQADERHHGGPDCLRGGAAPCAGVVIAVLGGASFQISGPTGAMSAVLVGIVASYGLQGVFFACFAAGALLLLAGIFKLGRLISFIPMPVIISLSFRQSLCYDSVHITSIFPQTQRQCYRRTDKPQPLQYHHLLGNFLLVLPKN